MTDNLISGGKLYFIFMTALNSFKVSFIKLNPSLRKQHFLFVSLFLDLKGAKNKIASKMDKNLEK